MVLAAFDFGDEAAVDLQAVDARIAQIAEGGKALSKVIEARPRAQLTQAIDPEAQGWEIFRGAVFGDLEHQLRSLLGGRRQLLAKPVDELRIKDRSGEKIDRNQAAERVAAFLARHDFAHDMTIEFLDQAQALGHRQENPGGNDHAAIVDHAQQNLLMVNRCRRSHAPHLLTEEQDTIFGEDAPQGFRPLAGRPRGHGPRSRALDLPGIGALGLGGAQGGVDLRKEIAEGLPRVADEASVRDVQGIDQPRIVQLRQRLHEPGDEFIGFRLRNVGQNDREIRAGDVRRKMVDAAQGTTMPLDQRAESFEQGIDPGEPELFVEAPQILQFEQDERAAQEAILGTDQEAQLHVEVAAVGQAAHRVAEILGPDPFHRLRLLLEHLLDLGRHPVHRLDHAAQLKRPRQMLLDRILAIANRLGLRLDRAQGTQHEMQEDDPKHKSQERSPEKPPEGLNAVGPQLRISMPGVGRHVDRPGLLPPGHDQGFAARCLERKGGDKPSGNGLQFLRCAFFDQQLAIDAAQHHLPVVAAVEDGVDQTLDHHHFAVLGEMR